MASLRSADFLARVSALFFESSIFAAGHALGPLLPKRISPNWLTVGERFIALARGRRLESSRRGSVYRLADRVNYPHKIDAQSVDGNDILIAVIANLR